MARSRDYAGDMRWGWTCPRCETDVAVGKDAATETFRWICEAESCLAVGFGFASRRRARIALRDYRERYRNVYR